MAGTVTNEQLKLSVDIVSLFEKFGVKLTKRGRSFVGVCPFHDDKDPSLSVDQEKQLFNCFGCGIGGDVFNAVENYNSCSFNDAVKWLKENYDYTKPVDVKPPAPKKEKVQKIYKLNDVAEHYRKALYHNEAAREYLAGRGISQHVIERFEIGYCSGELQQTERLKDAGIFTKFGRESFTGCVTFPIYKDGDVIHFYARSIDESAKYKHLYLPGGHPAIFNEKAFDNTDTIILTESVIDALSLITSGLDNVSCAYGLQGLTKIHIEKIHTSGIKNVIIAFDNDDQAREAVKKYTKILSNEGFNVKAVYPKSKDWNIDLINNKIDNSMFIEKKYGEQQSNREKITGQAHFKVLGVNNDDKLLYFIDRYGLMKSWQGERIGKSQLQTLAPITFWRNNFAQGKQPGQMRREDWEDAIDTILEEADSKEFNPDNVIGRGAFVTNGKIGYHDGKHTYGNFSDQIFLKKNRMNIGLESDAIEKDVAIKMCDVAKSLTFEKDIDCFRFLGWSALSPFCGALEWRPSILITGESGSGKSTIFDEILKKIAMPESFSAGTSVAGIRRALNKDSRPIVIEEAEGITDEEKKLRNEYFKLMRVSSSNDAPDLCKAKINGDGVDRYKMQNMFCFVCIDPTIKNRADENRIFHINLVKSVDTPNEWIKKKRMLRETFTKENCAMLRSYVWKNLDNIIRMLDDMSNRIQAMTGCDNRTAYAESLIFSTWFSCFCDKDVDTALKMYYDGYERIKAVDSTQELIDKMLTTIVDVDREKFSIYELLYTLNNDGVRPNDAKEKANDIELRLYRTTLNRIGIDLDKTGQVMIASNHDALMNMLKLDKGYGKILKRSRHYVEYKNHSIMKSQKKCYVMGDEFYIDKEIKILDDIGKLI